MRSPFGRRKRAAAELLRQLGEGEPVTLSGSLRRTSPRGWGPWTPAEIHLGADAAAGAMWHVDDPLAVGFAPGRGPVDVAFASVGAVWTRPVRFRTEAFWGLDAEIIVVEGERSTVELALDPAHTQLAVERLVRVLDLGT